MRSNLYIYPKEENLPLINKRLKKHGPLKIHLRHHHFLNTRTDGYRSVGCRPDFGAHSQIFRNVRLHGISISKCSFPPKGLGTPSNLPWAPRYMHTHIVSWMKRVCTRMENEKDKGSRRRFVCMCVYVSKGPPSSHLPLSWTNSTILSPRKGLPLSMFTKGPSSVTPHYVRPLPVQLTGPLRASSISNRKKKIQTNHICIWFDYPSWLIHGSLSFC